MIASAPQPTPAHRAALSLHSLSETDRQWVLQGLGAAQQAALLPLLRELEALGIPRAPELVRAIAEGADGDGASALGTLDAAGVRSLADVLRGEPPRLAATLLATGAWPWRDPLLCALPVPLADEIARLSAAPVPAGALAAAVIAEVGASMREQDKAQPRTLSLWQTLRHRLGSPGGPR